MRVYEFSKQCGISSKELLEILAQNGFKAASHMAVLTPEALKFLENKYKKKSDHKDKKEKEVTTEASDKSDKKVVSQEVHSVPQSAEKSQLVETKKKKEQAVLPTHSTIPSQPIMQQTLRSAEEKHSHARSEKNIQKTDTYHTTPTSTVPHAPSVVKPETAPGVTPSISMVIESMQVGDFAVKAHKPIADVIVTLLRWGIVAAKNHMLSEETVGRLIRHYGFEVAARAKEKPREEAQLNKVSTQAHAAAQRLPIVVVVGHVDHGKTTLLDFIRKTRVASREKGGITQHIGAYEARTSQGNIVFIDTPGHEAFSKMRGRGIKVADVVILVIAADDGIMPQTIEAIKQAKTMNVPIIVAVNKMDKVEPHQIEVIKRGLAQHDLLPEDWGGEVVVVPISAKTGQGVDQLLDMIILQSQMMELQADTARPAQGYVLEAKLEKGHGPVATVLCQQGTLRVGDYFVSGATTGRVNALVNSGGQRVMEVKPAVPVLVAGFSQLPHAGDMFTVISKDEYKKSRSQTDAQRLASNARPLTSQGSELTIILKTDTHSSKEAILGALANVVKKFEKKPTILHAAIGDVNESDVSLAATTGSIVYAFHVKTEPNALSLAQKNDVTIDTFDIIYKLLESLEAFAEGAKEIKMVKTKIGEAVVRQVFAIKGIGVIAGSYVRDGRFAREGSVVVWRGNQKIGEGKIKSLQRDKKTVKEVHAGYECGFLVEGLEDWAVDDRVECFIEVASQ